MKKKELIIKDCKSLFNLFDTEAGYLIDDLAKLTNKPYFDSVTKFLSEQKNKKLADKCMKCWFRIVPVAFTYGFVSGSMLNPNSKISLEGIQKISRTIKKFDILPLP
jgi:hypothetical protein